MQTLFTKKKWMVHIKKAFREDSFLTPKHHPDTIGHHQSNWGNFRSVLSPELANDLEEFMLDSTNYSVTQYDDLNPKHGDVYFTITPKESSGYWIPGSGVTRTDLPHVAFDTLVVVSGTTSSSTLHCFTESKINIERKLSLSNGLRYVGEIDFSDDRTNGGTSEGPPTYPGM